jgi:glycosyltransferase involved in cell wall biosynthesis
MSDNERSAGLRILHVMPSIALAFGGPTRSLVGYVKAAQSQGLDVTVAAPEPAPADIEAMRAALPGVPVNVFTACGSGAFVVAPGLLKWMIGTAAKYDVVHVHGLFNSVSSLAAVIATRNRCATVLRPFGTLSRFTFEHRRSWLKHCFFRLVDEPNVRRVEALHFTTTDERDEAARHGSFLARRAYVVPPPWMPPLAPAAIRSTPSRWTALFVSRLHPVKDVELLLEAWALVLAVLPDARLVIAGSGHPSYVSSLRASATRLSLDDRVAFVGYATESEKARLFEEADVFILASRHENFGVAVLEAAAAGIPVVVTREVQLAPFLEAQGLARVSARDMKVLANTIITTMRDDRMRAHCATNGREIITRRFSISQVGKELVAMYGAALTTKEAAS